jgi:hypothetical protein
MLCLAIIAPVINLSGSLPWFKIEQLLLPAFTLIYVWLVLAGLARPIKLNAMFAVGAAYSICILISIWYGSVFLGHTVIARDFYEIPKAIFPVLFFTFGLETDLSDSALHTLLSCFAGATALVCIYAWAQWADLSIAHRLTPYYSGGWHDEGALSHYRRVYSTMGNPNLLAQLMTFAISAFILAVAFRVGSRLRNAVMALACLVTLVMTGSRYGLLNTAFVVFVIFGLLLLNAERRRSAVFFLLLVLPIMALTAFIVARSNTATVQRVQTLRNPLTTDSFRDRVDDLWRDAGNQFVQSPFVGHGPAKTIFSAVITDSEYLDVLKQFGLTGLVIYLAYFIYPLRLLWRGIREGVSQTKGITRSSAANWCLYLAFTMGVTALVMNIGMSTFYNASLQAFLWMWLGIGIPRD